MPRGGSSRSSQTGFDTATSAPAELRTCTRTKQERVVSTGTGTEPVGNDAAGTRAITMVLGVLPT